MRSVVVLPQPEGPSSMKNSPSSIVKLEDFTALNDPKSLRTFSIRICAMALFPEVADDDEHHRADKCDDEGVAVEPEAEGLHQHHDTQGDQDRGQHFPRAATQAQQSRYEFDHLRTAPNVIPRSRCLRSRIVKTMTGTRKSVAAAATAGQSLPETPMIVGMKGGAVWALPDVS